MKSLAVLLIEMCYLKSIGLFKMFIRSSLAVMRKGLVLYIISYKIMPIVHMSTLSSYSSPIKI